MDLGVFKILIEKYFTDNAMSFRSGRLTDKIEFEKINRKILKKIPEWYKEILMKYPLVNLEIGVPNDFGDEELKGKPFKELPLMGLTFISAKEIENYALNHFPDYELIALDYIRIAEDKFGTQQGVYINSRENDPSVRLIFHDFGETGKEVLKESELLLEKFTDIFRYGRRRNLDGL
jgi:hypothetical protein